MKNIDFGNALVVCLTVVLFIAALFVKGITKDLFLEAGILLVSVKLIMFNHKQSQFDQETLIKLDQIQKDLSELKK